MRNGKNPLDHKCQAAAVFLGKGEASISQSFMLYLTPRLPKGSGSGARDTRGCVNIQGKGQTATLLHETHPPNLMRNQ